MEKREGSRAYRHAEFGYKIRKVWGWMDMDFPLTVEVSEHL